MKKILLLILFVLLVFAGYGIYLFNKKTPSLESEKPDYTLTANALFNSFNDDETLALSQYEGKIIQVNGKVIDIKKNDSISSLTLEADDAMFGGVNCSFRNLDKTINKGDMVTVKGRCQGFLMSVVLNNCVIVNKDE